MSPFTLKRRLQVPRTSESTFSFAASAIRTFIRYATSGKRSCRRSIPASPGTKSSAASSRSAAPSRNSRRATSLPSRTGRLLGSAPAAAPVKSNTSKWLHADLRLRSGTRRGTSAAIRTASWSTRRTSCGCRTASTLPVPRHCSVLASRLIPRCAIGRSARAQGRRRRSRWIGPHGREVCPCVGRAHRVHHVAGQAADARRLGADDVVVSKDQPRWRSTSAASISSSTRSPPNTT